MRFHPSLSHESSRNRQRLILRLLKIYGACHKATDSSVKLYVEVYRDFWRMAAQTSSTSSTASGTTSSDTIASAPTRVSPPPTTVNLGPLTTTFYPPDGCTSQTDVALGNANGQRGNPSIVLYGTLDQYSYCSFSAARHSAVKSCFPPNFGSYYNVVPTSGSGDVYPVYSPGLVCPAGYGPSCTFTKTTSSLPYIPDRDAVDYTIQQILKDCQTAIGCCPRCVFA